MHGQKGKEVEKKWKRNGKKTEKTAVCPDIVLDGCERFDKEGDKNEQSGTCIGCDEG